MALTSPPSPPDACRLPTLGDNLSSMSSIGISMSMSGSIVGMALGHKLIHQLVAEPVRICREPTVFAPQLGNLLTAIPGGILRGQSELNGKCMIIMNGGPGTQKINMYLHLLLIANGVPYIL
jgi:hypothetical protein